LEKLLWSFSRYAKNAVKYKRVYVSALAFSKNLTQKLIHFKSCLLKSNSTLQAAIGKNKQVKI